MKRDYDLYVVIVSQPFAYAKFNLLGRPIFEHAEMAVSNLPHSVLSCDKYIKITKKYDYLAVIYSDMPLVTEELLQKVARTMAQKFIKKLRLGKGFMIDNNTDKNFSAKYSLKIPEFTSVKDANTLTFVYNYMRKKIIEHHLNAGVIILNKENAEIDDTVKIEPNVIIEPYTKLKGNTFIKSGAVIKSGSIVSDSTICEKAIINQSVIEQSIIGKNTTVGPFSYIRLNSTIGDGCRIGDFVEIKKSTLGDGVKSAHLAYIGDAKIGDKTNIGCGTVFANYDGKCKNKTTVGCNAFIGANTNLVAPVKIGDNAYIAAGTTVTHDIANNKFCIGRIKQQVRENKLTKE